MISRKFGLLCFIASFLAVSMPVSVMAQVNGLTAEQQRLLSQLPASQRKALMDRFLGNTGVQSQPQARRPKLDEEDSEPAEATVLDEPESVLFGVGDTVVLMPLLENGANVGEVDPALLDRKNKIAAANPYRIGQDGHLNIPGMSGIALVGLDEEQAKIRLEADPELVGIDVEVFRLPVTELGFRSLLPFGYDVFDGSTRSAEPNENLPVPSNYVVGPGDWVRLQFYGNQNAEYEIQIDRNGTLSLPELGPMSVAGLSIDSVRNEIQNRVAEQLIGTQVSVALGQLRAIQVVLVGDVKHPGTYTVSALASMIDVLTVAGGIKEIGSLRAIQLKRSGKTISTLDLYDLLLKGDSSRNRRVANGDVIFVPAVGSRVTVSGEVKRPAVYELRTSADLSSVMALAGGVTAEADRENVSVRRSLENAGVGILTVDLSTNAGAKTRVVDGDLINVPSQTNQFDDIVTLSGEVDRRRQVQWSSGLTLRDLLPDSRSLAENADRNYVLIVREQERNGDIRVMSADLEQQWRDKGRADIKLMPRDRIIVFAKAQTRANYLAPILDQLRSQGTSDAPTRIVRIRGQVKNPGEYPLEDGMTLSDLVRAGGGLSESAYRSTAELTRYVIEDNKTRETKLMSLQLADALAGDASADVMLAPFDYVNIKEVSRWREDAIVEIRGEVLFPGRYPIFQGETLVSVLKRAGGLTNFAFPEGSSLTRATLRKREREQLDVLARRVESDLAALALSDPGQIEAIGIGQSLLDQLKNAKPAGRLVIDLASVVDGSGDGDVLMRDGDLLVIPPKTQEVTVLGEVQYATSHFWEPGLSREDYINRSGGMTVKADKRRIYVVRANGEVVVSNRSRFFSRSRGFDIKPGDSIVVPLNTDRVKPLVLWTSATQIVYNLAIAAAAVNSF